MPGSSFIVTGAAPENLAPPRLILRADRYVTVVGDILLSWPRLVMKKAGRESLSIPTVPSMTMNGTVFYANTRYQMSPEITGKPATMAAAFIVLRFCCGAPSISRSLICHVMPLCGQFFELALHNGIAYLFGALLAGDSPCPIFLSP